MKGLVSVLQKGRPVGSIAARHNKPVWAPELLTASKWRIITHSFLPSLSMWLQLPAPVAAVALLLLLPIPQHRFVDANIVAFSSVPAVVGTALLAIQLQSYCSSRCCGRCCGGCGGCASAADSIAAVVGVALRPPQVGHLVIFRLRDCHFGRNW